MLEREVNLKIEEVYPKLKDALVEKDCKVISEEPPRQICVKQGSLWGIVPQTAKKIVNVNFVKSNNHLGIHLVIEFKLVAAVVQHSLDHLHPDGRVNPKVEQVISNGLIFQIKKSFLDPNV